LVPVGNLGGVAGVGADGTISILIVAGQQMAPACHNNLQRTCLALVGSDVLFVVGRVRPEQLRTMRPSYINAILIQRSGTLVPGGCSECQRRGLTPFPECRRTLGHFRDAYGNYK